MCFPPSTTAVGITRLFAENSKAKQVLCRTVCGAARSTPSRPARPGLPSQLSRPHLRSSLLPDTNRSLARPERCSVSHAPGPELGTSIPPFLPPSPPTWEVASPGCGHAGRDAPQPPEHPRAPGERSGLSPGTTPRSVIAWHLGSVTHRDFR